MHRPLLLVLAVVVALVGCAPAPKSPLPPLDELNVLVIVIDTLGARHLGSLAPLDEPDLDTSPVLDALAAGGVNFTRAQSTAPWTQPSVGSLFTGLTPSRHGAIHLLDSFADENETLAEMMRVRGKSTAGVISHHLINRELGYAQGFDRYDETPIAGHRGISSKKVTDSAIHELRRMKDENFFLFVHYFDPHNVYRHHEDFSRTDWYEGPARQWDPRIRELRARRDAMTEEDVRYFRDTYREEIAWTDHQVGRLLNMLDNLGLEENTLVIVTSDHGEAFMEHGWIGHTRYLYDPFVHVPFIVSLPGTLTPATVDAPVSLVDVVPTLLAAAGERDLGDYDGASLLPLLAGEVADSWNERPVFAEVAFLAGTNEQDPLILEKEAFLASVTQGDFKLVHDVEADTWELYDRDADPGETENLYDDAHPVVVELRPQLVAWEEGKVETWGREFVRIEEMSPEQVERLRSLGYIR